MQSSDDASVLVSGNNTWADTYGPVLGENDPRHSYGLNVAKNTGYATVFFYTLTAGEKKLEIVCTTIIPEFPMAILILIAGITVMMIISKIKNVKI